MSLVKLYDTTLRDGTQAEDISFLVEDKIRIAHKLDEIGIHYIEGGWPGSNPKDVAFFKDIKKEKLSQAKIAAFGSTRRAKVTPDKDHNLKTLIQAEPDVCTIFGKTWDFHVHEALRISLEENLELIFDSLEYLKANVPEVFYDAEHFFDGYKANPDYAIKTLKAAQDAKADCIVLCDTNGGTMPFELVEIIREVRKHITAPLGIHTHNDSECAVANSLHAVSEGIVQVQGTINGFGERCGNANLCSIIPALKLKMKRECIGDDQLRKLRDLSRFVYELANLSPNKHQAYVGNSAFAHKGGVHVSAIQRHPETYEHLRPELVGNMTRVLVSDLSGRSNILAKAEEFNIKMDSKDPVTLEILENIKEMENRGYQFEGAEASFELLMKRALGTHRKFFSVIGFRVIDEKRHEDQKPLSEATIMVKVGGKIEHTAAEGNGPVNALDNALRKALEKFYPRLKEVKLLDYKVRVLPAGQGTASSIRVLIESGDKESRWGTVGVSENIVDASYQALLDSVEYKLHKSEEIEGSKK
ncbi:citramalate synthase [Geobacter sulfurreducens]|uniref:(R)-citramalate synthase n=1 Tax=Geobacter sulfurreducens (strain ATCC 51573 / DSM 12127 / PCA) TaxID=243231 RepID=CIMA_GEOSL|nr:citramalate synthase [Geobacter sulfurreducens]Q74C76.1 RecName: Full=(R)-citramalate synthase; AltName: Full=Citramalate synthase [Geobacter sulfurreducens PCA]AAR35175.1 citramalate synthase [Geobacter sulfurreducens PCA]ADI84633.1 citramalate synthase [Geobacter sulfurreducens KN400]AJY71146.1 transferase [Geobacter sulfurreducens]QVW33752.1 citramalate synthase [Geobacter sulfurreducens]UAC02544.1 citramalate synthase [Geobacter sulfurreducens]